MNKAIILSITGFSLLTGAAAQTPRERGHAERPKDITSTTTTMWIPPANTSWQWQLTTPVDLSVVAQMYDIDMFDNDATVVASLHALGIKVVCYISAGTYENWRPDAASFPASVLGAANGWPGENWLDIRQIGVLGPIMNARLSLCQAKGFDAVEFDNVDGYSNNSGFPLTYNDQLTYNKWLAAAAHTYGLSAALKNDVEQAADLVGDFDWTLNEQCFQYHECNMLAPFTSAGKAVFNVEYQLSPDKFCSQANAMNFNSLKKKKSLGAYRVPCR